MKKLAFLTVLLLTCSPFAFATVLQLNIELKVGGVWYIGDRHCRNGDGICLSSSQAVNASLFYNDVTKEMWLEVRDTSKIYPSLRDSLTFTTDSPIDTFVTSRIQPHQIYYLTKGTYPVEKANNIKKIKLNYQITPALPGK